MNSYQASSTGYSSIPSRQLATGLKAFPEKQKEEKEQKRRPVQLCFVNFDEDKPSSNWSSLAGMPFVNSLNNDYTVIWIDFENHHTVEGIIAEIFKLVRISDPQAPLCAITNINNAFGTVIPKAVERIRDAFKRGRYVLVLDLVESFGRPQMVHHGIISSDDSDFEDRLIDLQTFLYELLDIKNIEKPYWDSYIVVTAHMPRLRHSFDDLSKDSLPASYKLMLELLTTIKKESENCKHINRFSQKSGRKYIDIISEDKFIPEKEILSNSTLSYYSRAT